MVQSKSRNILIHACCGICSGYPISLLKEMGYSPVVYFCNPNLDTEEEFCKRLQAQKIISEYFNVKLIVENYNHEEFLHKINGLEKEPERGKRCIKCIELRLDYAAQKTKELQFDLFTTSLVISPHKDFNMIKNIGELLAKKYELEYLPLDFKIHRTTSSNKFNYIILKNFTTSIAFSEFSANIH